MSDDGGDQAPQRPVDERQPAASIAGHRYGWFLGFAALIAIAASVIGHHGDESPGVLGLKVGARLAPFAVPLATADISCERPADPCDANIATRRGQRSAGSRPACEVRGPAILNVCELTERGPLVLAFLGTTGGDCADALDPLQEVARRHPGVQVAVVGIRGELSNLRTIVANHRGSFPVGWDRDGILASLYGVALCPYVTYARWRGRVQGTSIGDLDRRALDRHVGAAVAASKRSGWSPPQNR